MTRCLLRYQDYYQCMVTEFPHLSCIWVERDASGHILKLGLRRESLNESENIFPLSPKSFCSYTK